MGTLTSFEWSALVDEAGEEWWVDESEEDSEAVVEGADEAPWWEVVAA